MDLTTEVQLAGNSKFVGWELTCFGLPASDAPFSRGSFRQRYRVHREGVPLFIDGLDVNERNCAALLQGAAALRGSAVSGFFLAGPFAEPPAETLKEALRSGASGATTGISWLGEFALGRYLGASAEEARRQFNRWWQMLRPALLQREACAPRIWLT